MTANRAVAAAPAAAASPTANRAGGARAIIGGAKAALVPFNALKAAVEDMDASMPKGWWDRARRITAVYSERDNSLDKWTLRHPEYAEKNCQALADWIDDAPDLAILNRAVSDFGETDEPAAGAQLNQVRAIVSLLVDAYPNARPHAPEVYFEVLVDQAVTGRFSVANVAQAYQAIVAGSKFPPSPAEFIEACEKGRREGRDLTYRATTVAMAVAKAKAALADAREQGPLTRMTTGVFDEANGNVQVGSAA